MGPLVIWAGTGEGACHIRFNLRISSTALLSGLLHKTVTPFLFSSKVSAVQSSWLTKSPNCCTPSVVTLFSCATVSTRVAIVLTCAVSLLSKRSMVWAICLRYSSVLALARRRPVVVAVARAGRGAGVVGIVTG